MKGAAAGATLALPLELARAQIFASPLRFDRDWNPHSHLAESWTVQDDERSLLLRLAKGATFDDGKPITSEDVAFSIMTSKANHPFHPRNTSPVGSGRYKFFSFNPREAIVLEKNPNFFIKGQPKFDRLIFRIIQDSASPHSSSSAARPLTR